MTRRRDLRRARRSALLERLYGRLNRRDLIAPDPLEYVLRFGDPADREVVALVSAALAYGSVLAIKGSVDGALSRMGGTPHRYLMETTPEQIRRGFAGFRHRVTSGEEVADLLVGARSAIEKSGSLRAAFEEGIRDGEGTVVPALERFVGRLRSAHGPGPWHLLPAPSSGSACKRLSMMLRWMVRRDAVDPGGWAVGMESALVMPLDTHTFRLARAMGLTARRTADLKAALEVTEGFRAFAPGDPVRYDFSLSRLGIRGELLPDGFLAEWNAC